jgi:pyrroline-5-carboxylate reductase
MGFDLSEKRVAVLGAGKMGGILLKALLEKGLLSPKSTFATVQHEDRARALSEKLGVSVGTDNLAAVRDADIIFVCVKPQVVQEVMEQIRPNV